MLNFCALSNFRSPASFARFLKYVNKIESEPLSFIIRYIPLGEQWYRKSHPEPFDEE